LALITSPPEIFTLLVNPSLLLCLDYPFVYTFEMHALKYFFTLLSY